MATESALTLTANDISASEQAELNRWFDKLAQNAPEDVQMTGKLRNWQREILQRASDNRGVVLTTRIDGDKSRPMDNRARVLVGHGWLKYVSFDECQSAYELTDAGRAALAADTAASEPQPNAATGWITKTEAEARAEFEDGWNAAERENFVSVVDFSKQQPEADRKTQMDALQADILGKRINRIEAIKRYRVIAGEPSIETALEVVKQMETGRLTWEQQHDEIERQQAEIERLQAENNKLKADRQQANEIGLASSREALRLSSERDALKAALKPFADVYTEWLKRSGNGDYKTWLHSHYLTSLSYPREWYKKAHDIISSK